MDKASYSSPAKINFFLEIKGKRSDGYHEVVTWLQTVDICDTITVARSARDYSTLRSDDTSMPFGKRNLCIKAYEIARNETSLRKDDTIEITLSKRIPLGSGLGGGSSNAASVIRALDEIFELGLPLEEKLRLAVKVGTDVPFFIIGGSALATGRGEILEPLPALPEPLWLVVVKPDFSVSTGEAYGWLKNYKGEKKLDPGVLKARVSEGDLDFILDSMYNCFEPVVGGRYTDLERVRGLMNEAGCLKVIMTGSGSGLFGICADEAAARAAADSISKQRDLQFISVCRTL